MSRAPLALDLTRFDAAPAGDAAAAPVGVVPDRARPAVAFHDLARPPPLVASLSRALLVVAVDTASFDAALARAAAGLPRPGAPLEGADDFVVVDAGDVVVTVDARLPVAGLFR